MRSEMKLRRNPQNFTILPEKFLVCIIIFLHIFWRARVCCHSFAYVPHFVFLRDVWMRTQAAVASRRATMTIYPPISQTV
jgi:hypothetical protein